MLSMTRDIINSDTLRFYENDFCVIGNLYEDNVSMDDVEESTSDNSYFTFVKSFIVVIDKQSE